MSKKSKTPEEFNNYLREQMNAAKELHEAQLNYINEKIQSASAELESVKEQIASADVRTENAVDAMAGLYRKAGNLEADIKALQDTKQRLDGIPAITEETKRDLVKEINRFYADAFEAVINPWHDCMEKAYEAADRVLDVETSFGEATQIVYGKNVQKYLVTSDYSVAVGGIDFGFPIPQHGLKAACGSYESDYEAMMNQIKRARK